MTPSFRLVLPLLGLLVLGGCKRTEVLIGILTDIEMPDTVDTVRLTASRDGVELLHNDWPISGIRSQPFELPGSFGIYTADGSEPRVDVRVAALKGDSEVLHRDATLSLVKEKTLFLRMTLVKRCQPMQCPSGQTCVEGRCADPLVDSTTLPEFVTDLDKTVSCSSGSAFINTSTKEPVPVSGPGDCNPDEQCTEGTCYKLPPSMMSSVSGTQIDTFLDDRGETTVVEDLSRQRVAAFVPDAQGVYTRIDGSGSTDGTFTVPGVPPGVEYLLQVGNQVVVTKARVLDFGSVKLGRTSATPATQTMHYVFTLSGLNPWQPLDILEAYSAGGEQFVFDQDDGTGMIFPTGSTMIANHQSQVIPSSTQFGRLVDTAAGDVVYVGQISTRQQGSLTYQTFSKLLLPSVKNVDGQPTAVTGNLKDVPLPQSFAADFRASAFDAAAHLIHPRAQLFSNAGVDVNTRPGPAGYGLFGATMDLLFATFSPDAVPSDQMVSAPYGTPQPGSWGIFVDAREAMYVNFSLPGTSNMAAVLGTVGIDVDLATAQSAPLQPMITPVNGAAIDGRAFSDDQTTMNDQPTLSWSPPSTGKPTGYTVSFTLLVVQNGRTVKQPGPVFSTTNTSLHVPPGLLLPGTTCVARVDATITGGVNTARQPFRSDLPSANASVLSGLLTIGGSQTGARDGGMGGTAADLGLSAPPDLGAGACSIAGAPCTTPASCCSFICAPRDGGAGMVCN